jgi:ferredoxin--NADP+ reductase
MYAARKLQKSGCEVVILNRDIRPGGLAEYGIFHNKYKMKAGLRNQFAKILNLEGIHYRGNVSLGPSGSLTIEDMESLGFDAVILAVGAQGIKWLQIDGSEATHIYDAKQVVYHFNGLPDFAQQPVHLGEHLVIIGAGNVAVDITHWAVQQNVPRITWLVRRGPNQVKYTRKEIGYVGAHVDRSDLRKEIERIEPQLSNVGESVEETWETLERPMGDTRIEGSDSVLHMRFACQAQSVQKDESGNIVGLNLVENELYLKDETVRCRATDSKTQMPVDTLVFCVGDAVDPELGFQLDSWGNYAMESEHSSAGYGLAGRPGWFAAGWARVASDGLVGKARKDAEAACAHVSEYLANHPPQASTSSRLKALDTLLSTRGAKSVDWSDFQKTRAAEDAQAKAQDLPDFRFVSNKDMLQAAEID